MGDDLFTGWWVRCPKPLRPSIKSDIITNNLASRRLIALSTQAIRPSDAILQGLVVDGGIQSASLELGRENLLKLIFLIDFDLRQLAIRAERKVGLISRNE